MTAGLTLDRLTEPPVVAAVEASVGRQLGRPWRVDSTVDLRDRSSSPALLYRGQGLSVFAKLASSAVRLVDELDGLELLRATAGVRVATPIGSGWLELPDGAAVLLTEGMTERPPNERTRRDWEEIGRTLALIHRVRGAAFGSERDGWFGPLRQDNRPVASARWADFYAQRRLLPALEQAVGAGRLPTGVARRVERLVDRLPALVGPEPEPRLLHGDAQHHNFLSTPAGTVVIDASPYHGHPEVDLALLDYFSPVPPDTWSAYAEVFPLGADFGERRELWRIFAYLAVLTVDGGSDWGRQFMTRLQTALARYA